ncbi:MAG: regulatory protein RecX [Halioglobus sp.]
MSYSPSLESLAINDDELDKIGALNPVDVRFAAMNLLARREHSQRELRQKLLRRFDNVVVIDEQIALLSDENLQSDERFACSYARMRSGRGFGPLKVRQEMRERGLSDQQIQDAFNALETSWFDLAEQAYKKKFGEDRPADLKERSKRARFMQHRGFVSEHYAHFEE